MEITRFGVKSIIVFEIYQELIWSKRDEQLWITIQQVSIDEFDAESGFESSNSTIDEICIDAILIRTWELKRSGE